MAATAWNNLLSVGSAAKTLPDAARVQVRVGDATQTAITVIQPQSSRPVPKVEAKKVDLREDLGTVTERLPQDTVDRLRLRIAARESVTNELPIPASQRPRPEDPGSIFAAALRAIPASARVVSPVRVTPPVNVTEPRRARGAIPVHRHPVGYFPRSSKALVGADAFVDTSPAAFPTPPPSPATEPRRAEVVAPHDRLTVTVPRRIVIALSATAAAFTIGLVGGMFARDLQGVPSVSLVRTAAAEPGARRVEPRSSAISAAAEAQEPPIEINLDALDKPRTFVRVVPRRVSAPAATTTTTTPTPTTADKPQRAPKAAAVTAPSSGASLFEDRD